VKGDSWIQLHLRKPGGKIVLEMRRKVTWKGAEENALGGGVEQKKMAKSQKAAATILGGLDLEPRASERKGGHGDYLD